MDDATQPTQTQDPPSPPKLRIFDSEIAGRTAALTTMLGYFIGEKWHFPAEVTSAAGLIAGITLDQLLYQFKQVVSPIIAAYVARLKQGTK